MPTEEEYYKPLRHQIKKPGGQVERSERKRKLFALAYLGNGGDATKAAIEVGYSANTAGAAGSRLLKDDRVKQAMKRQIAKVEKETGATYDWKVNVLKQTIEKCMLCQEDKDGLFKPQGVIAAVAELNKMAGDYAPTKTESKNLNVNAEVLEVKAIMDQFKREY